MVFLIFQSTLQIMTINLMHYYNNGSTKMKITDVYLVEF